MPAAQKTDLAYLSINWSFRAWSHKHCSRRNQNPCGVESRMFTPLLILTCNHKHIGFQKVKRRTGEGCLSGPGCAVYWFCQYRRKKAAFDHQSAFHVSQWVTGHQSVTVNHPPLPAPPCTSERSKIDSSFQTLWLFHLTFWRLCNCRWRNSERNVSKDTHDKLLPARHQPLQLFKRTWTVHIESDCNGECPTALRPTMKIVTTILYRITITISKWVCHGMSLLKILNFWQLGFLNRTA